MMEVVVQKEATGCGLAAVAMLAGEPYAAVKKLANSLGIYVEDEALWSDTTYVRRLLSKYGIPVSQKETPFIAWDELPNLALLALNYRLEQGHPSWHWSLFIRREGTPVVLDPAAYLESNRRTDFDRMHPPWFIEVTGISSD